MVQQEISSLWPGQGRPCADAFGFYPTGNGELLKGFRPLSKMTRFVF